MKVHILFSIKKTSGGANQFLKALREWLRRHDRYAERPQDADIIMYNSYQYIDEVAKFRRKYPNKICVHRVDGPIRLYNKMSDKRDFVTNTANHTMADASIFISDWCRQRNYRLGLRRRPLEQTILNAPDSSIFYPAKRKAKNKKTRIIATAWSVNPKKGYGVYKWLDQNLDFDNYEFCYAGRSSMKFKNAIHLGALNSQQLADELRKSDIYITASQNDPCSNALIEALHTGLPAIVLNDGGHPELVGDAGETFNRAQEIPALIEKIMKNKKAYRDAFALPSFETVCTEYYNFLETVYTEVSQGRVKHKKFSALDYAQVHAAILVWKGREFLDVKFNI